jgi:hypothetical protein
MDVCHFLDENHFHLLFDDYSTPYVERILESHQEPSLNPVFHFSYSPVLVDDFLVGSTYFHPHDEC